MAERLASVLSGALAHDELWFALLAAAIGGVLTALTPCVYPLIPITIRYFGGMKRSRGGLVSAALLYVLGMTLLYAFLGTAFASLHWVFGSFLASPYVVGTIALFCVAMGLSMLGVFTLQLPSELNTRLSQVGGQTLGGAFAMGLVSGLIAAPCTGPVLAVILTLIATSGALVWGFWLMVAFGLGLGLPFLLLAVSSGHLQRLPAGGVWMETVKLVLATGMFVVALYFGMLACPPLENALRAAPYAPWLGGGLACFGALGGVLMLTSRRMTEQVFLKAASVLCLTVGLGLAVFGSSETQQVPQDVPPIAWELGHDAALERARKDHQPVMVDFTADWCQACKELERDTYVDVGVRREAQRFVAIKLDATELDDAMKALFDRYAVLGLPTVVFIDGAGNILPKPRVTGFVGPQRFYDLMTAVH